jgi:hypothetical protein
MNEVKYELDGLIYKIGVHNLVFMLINGEWIKSSKQISELRRGKEIR